MSKPMTALSTDYLALAQNLPPGGLTILPDVTWGEYEFLLDAVGEASHLRLSYDNGRLQIMSLSPEHEGIAGLIPPLILVLADECQLNYLSRRSTTLKQSRERKGAEPDDCYYFKNFKLIAGKKRIDLDVDPPPDLAFEIDVSSLSLSKFPIYASIGVPELWRHDGEEMRFYRLDGEDYFEISHSDIFPFLTPQIVIAFLRKGEEEGALPMAREFRAWVQANRDPLNIDVVKKEK